MIIQSKGKLEGGELRIDNQKVLEIRPSPANQDVNMTDLKSSSIGDRRTTELSELSRIVQIGDEIRRGRGGRKLFVG